MLLIASCASIDAMSINPRVAALLPTYDPTKPVVVIRAFMGGSRKYKPNEAFDVEAEKANHAQVEALVKSGYLKNGVPVEPTPDPERDARRRKRFEDKAAAGREAVKKAGRPRPGGPVRE